VPNKVYFSFTPQQAAVLYLQLSKHGPWEPSHWKLAIPSQ